MLGKLRYANLTCCMYYKQNTKHSLFEGRANTIECLNYILYVHTVNYELARCPKSRLSELFAWSLGVRIIGVALYTQVRGGDDIFSPSLYSMFLFSGQQNIFKLYKTCK